MFDKFLSLFSGKASRAKIQSFTFYIPSPPDRKNGYREKQFDKIFYNFINKGYEIMSIHTTPNSHASRSGMWFMCIVKAKTKEAEALDLDAFFHDQLDEELEPQLQHESRVRPLPGEELIFIADDPLSKKKSNNEE